MTDLLTQNHDNIFTTPHSIYQYIYKLFFRISHQKIGISRVHFHPLLVQSICSVKLLNSANNNGFNWKWLMYSDAEGFSPAGHSRLGHRGRKFPHTWKEDLNVLAGFLVTIHLNDFICWFKQFLSAYLGNFSTASLNWSRTLLTVAVSPIVFAALQSVKGY